MCFFFWFSFLGVQLWDLFQREVLSEKVDIWVTNFPPPPNNLCSFSLRSFSFIHMCILMTNVILFIAFITYGDALVFRLTNLIVCGLCVCV